MYDYCALQPLRLSLKSAAPALKPSTAQVAFEDSDAPIIVHSGLAEIRPAGGGDYLGGGKWPRGEHLRTDTWCMHRMDASYNVQRHHRYTPYVCTHTLVNWYRSHVQWLRRTLCMHAAM